MEMVNWQISSLSLLFLTGLFWGMLYDLFKSLLKRPATGLRRKGENLRDLAFWVISILTIIPLIFFANWLEVRFYLWLSVGSGILAYKFLFHQPLTVLLGSFRKK